MSLSQLSELNNNSLNNLNNSNSNSFKKNILSLNNSSLNKSNSVSLNKSKSKSNSVSLNKSKSVSLNKSKKREDKIYQLVDFPKKGDYYGDYKGKTPKQAAKKAFSRLARLSHLNNSNQKFIVFFIREKYGAQKEFKYMGQRVKLDRNIEIKRGNKTVTIKYKNIVNKYKDL